MATLQELLDLLPDNDTGDIDAADLRYIVTELWNNNVDLQVATVNLDARVSELEAASGLVAINGSWQINPQVGPPGGGQVSPSSGDFLTSPTLMFSVPDLDGTDLTAALMGATRVYAQRKDDASLWARWIANAGVAIDNGTNVEVTVTLDSTSPGVDPAVWQEAIFVLGVPVA